MESPSPNPKFDFEVEWAQQLKLGLPSSAEGMKVLARIFWNLGYAGGIQHAIEIMRAGRVSKCGVPLSQHNPDCDICNPKPVSSPAGEPGFRSPKEGI